MELIRRIETVTLGGMDSLTLTPGPGGWIHADWKKGRAWLRLAKDEQDRLTRISELHVSDPTQITIRRIPLHRIHAAITMRGAGPLQVALAIRINEDVPASLLSAAPPSGGAALERRYRLTRPTRRRLDDAFYRDVAHAYQSAIAFGDHPRKAIVADTGKSDATVASWVMEARRRGYLPQTEPGKVTA
jgi:hypothetical protein